MTQICLPKRMAWVDWKIAFKACCVRRFGLATRSYGFAVNPEEVQLPEAIASDKGQGTRPKDTPNEDPISSRRSIQANVSGPSHPDARPAEEIRGTQSTTQAASEGTAGRVQATTTLNPAGRTGVKPGCFSAAEKIAAEATRQRAMQNHESVLAAFTISFPDVGRDCGRMSHRFRWYYL
jgi:hypothetical protein